MSRVLVVGGGAAGMMSAVAAARQGHQVTLLEQNEKLGKKLYITGKGRCNVTNDSDVDNLLAHTMRNRNFLYSAFYAFDSRRMMEFLRQEGLELKTERGNRVFPKSDHASDVIRTLERAMKRRNVSVLLHTRVLKILHSEGRCCGLSVRTAGGETRRMAAEHVIVATGGLSYPSTGATGDGYRFGRETGHALEECVPCLVPLETEETFPKKLQGLSMKNVSLRLCSDGKVLYEEQGEMLFTHFGVSGPLVLSASAHAAGRRERLTLILDVKPALSEKQLDNRILRDFADCKNSYFKNSLGKLLPSKLIPVVVELSGIEPDKQVNEVTREERRRLVSLLKGMKMTVCGMRGYQEAVITRGGICVRDVNPATMESKKLPGLSFAGEVLDLDAETGGYNLQIAWSTGYLAGSSIGG